ncbi:LysR family transcriptional regulator [Aquipseudomonas alcaligenes]|uniref:LysR family transcriptional regulator n=1 Tax=Aquipseudomonas alcaligenes TaxID=43263 RepID=A0A2V4KF65_AQUAC|nr:LysR family transcriptional regulator [Pseudomonas alcaligenes]PYC20245.1 LysR family transcriptional regulator [Pseudomonas alcaligenes]
MFSDTDCDYSSPTPHARLPSLNALRCFEAAARLESFSRAAAELHVTHGAISRSVRLLEQDLGVALFERRSRRVFLTEPGRLLAEAVRDGLELMHVATQKLRRETRQKRRVVISCEPTLLMRWLIPRWADFRSRYSDIDFHLVAGGGPFSFDAGLDLAIRRNDFMWPTHYHSSPLFEEQVGPVCRPDKVTEWFHRDGASTTLSDGATLLQTRTRPDAWHEWSAATGKLMPKGPALSFEHFYFSLQAAVAGLGVAIGPWHLVKDDIQTGVLSAPMGFAQDGSVYCLLAPAPLPLESMEQQLLEWLRQV